MFIFHDLIWQKNKIEAYLKSLLSIYFAFFSYDEQTKTYMGNSR